MTMTNFRNSNICKSKTYNSNSRKVKKGEIEVEYCRFLIYEMVYLLKVDCDKHVYTINSKADTKLTTTTRVIAKKPMKDIK